METKDFQQGRDTKLKPSVDGETSQQETQRVGEVVGHLEGLWLHHSDEGGDDLFIHQSSIRSEGYRNLAPEESVEFEVEVDNSGRNKAVEVTGPDSAPVQGSRGGSSGGRGSFGGGGRGGGRG
ncbi:unnamed protein product [Brassica oleracea]